MDTLEEQVNESHYSGLETFRIILKILAFAVLILGIVFSKFHRPTNLFSMATFVGGIM